MLLDVSCRPRRRVEERTVLERHDVLEAGEKWVMKRSGFQTGGNWRGIKDRNEWDRKKK